MILEMHGVKVASYQSWVDFGIEEIAYDLHWFTERGWVTLEAAAPTLCMVPLEIGGRCELRARSDQAAEGEYFGSGALTFATPGSRVVVQAAEIRQARLCCFVLNAAGADYLPPEAILAIQTLRTRYMFRNQRIRTCAELLDRDHARPGTSPAYARALSTALYATLIEMGQESREPPNVPGLPGSIWSTISRHIRDYLDEPISIETLAGLAQMPASRFGEALREMTGMSLRQWQMDHRVRSAQRMLMDNPNESLAEIGSLCGFADQSHFSRAFLKVVGLTPTAWLHGRR
jgi:AraC-like DNA-binding protein